MERKKTMNEIGEGRIGEKRRLTIAWLLMAAVLAMLLALNVFWPDHWLDSDMAAEMVFSRLLSQEGKFLATDGWFYSTEFRVLYTQIIMEPLFFLTDNWHVIRTLTNVICYILLLLGYLYMVRPLGMRHSLEVFSAVLLFLPFSEAIMTHVQMGNTYMAHMIIVCFGFGLFLRLAQSGRLMKIRDGKMGWKDIVRCVLYLMLCVVCGLSGVRYMLALQVPLVLTCIVLFLKSKCFAKLRRNPCREEFKELFSGYRLRALFYSLVGMAMALFGYLINVTVVEAAYDFQTYEGTNFITVYQGVLWERAQDIIGSILLLFGYIEEKGFLSLRGLISLIAFVMIAGIVFLTVRTARNLRENSDTEDDNWELTQRRFVLWFFVTAFLLHTFVFLFATGTIVSRYYLTVFLFVPAILGMYYEEEKLPLDKWMVTVVLCVCMVLCTTKTVFSYISKDKNEDRKDVIAFLEDEDYSFGYATYWNANITTELSNGEIEVANISDLDELDYFFWSTPRRYYEEGYCEGKTFLLVTRQEAEEYGEEPVMADGFIVYEDENYVVYHFDSVQDFEQYR